MDPKAPPKATPWMSLNVEESENYLLLNVQPKIAQHR